MKGVKKQKRVVNNLLNCSNNKNRHACIFALPPSTLPKEDIARTEQIAGMMKDQGQPDNTLEK